MKKQLLFALLFSLFAVTGAQAQTDANDSNVYCAVKKDGHWGFIDKTGKIVIPFGFEDAYGFSEGLALVKYRGKWGFIDKDAKFVLKPIFESGHSFEDNRALVSYYDAPTKTTTFGYITRKGEMIMVLADNQFGYDFHDGLARVRLNMSGDQTFGFVDTMGQWVLSPKFELALDFSEGAAPVYYNNKWGYIDWKGHSIIGPQFDQAFNFHEHRAYVEIGNKSTYIDGTGVPVLPNLMTDIDYEYHEGLTAFKKDGKMGFMDQSGIVIIPPKFENVDFSHFSEGLAMVQMKDAKGNLKWGFCNKEGKIVIPAEFDFVMDFRYGTAVAVKNNKYGIIDMNGNWIVKPVYEDAMGFTAYYR